MIELKETSFEYISGAEYGGFSTSETKWINKIEKYAKQYPDEVQIIARKADGSIFAHAPISWFKFSPKKKMNNEQREAARERMINRQKNK